MPMTCPTTCQQTASSMQTTSNSSLSRNRHDILQSSPNVSTSCSKGWELDLNPTNPTQPLNLNHHLPLVTPPIMSLTPSRPITHPSPRESKKNSITKDLGIVLSTRLSAEANDVSAANKARRVLFYLNRISTALAARIFSPCTKF